MKTGLALAGGGARGAAHIGVLQVFKEEGIAIDAIAGSSAGAIVGAMYAASLDTDWVEDRFRSFLKSDVFNKMAVTRLRRNTVDSDSTIMQLGRYVKDKLVMTIALSRKGIVDRDKLVDCIHYLLPVDRFSDLKLPLSVVATDLNTGNSIIHTSGNLIEAVVQSCSIPGVVPPTQKNGQVVVDGGVYSPIPVEEVKKMGVQFIIGVDIARSGVETIIDYNIFELMARSEQVTSVRLSRALSEKADVVIRPEVKGAHWSEFDKYDEFLESGKKSARESVSDIRNKMAERAKWSYRLKQKIINSL
tara:strand:+ start:809 stop:1717 length:909 start_codon:yes stop_codon:yes gene_type:complete